MTPVYFQFNHLSVIVYGGPYNSKPDDMFGVKLAEEIHAPYNINLPIEDFSVPDERVLKRAIVDLLFHIRSQHTTYNLSMKVPYVYAGCMGGIGRTGLFMAALAELSKQCGNLQHVPDDNIVGFIRTVYLGHALETDEQVQYINNLDFSDIVQFIEYL